VPSAYPAALASFALLVATAATAAADRAPWEKQENGTSALHGTVRSVVVQVDAGTVVLRHDRQALVETTSTWFMTKPEVSVSQRNGVLTVRSHCPEFAKGPAVHVGDPLGSCRTDVVVTLAGWPRGATVSTGGGDIAVTGVRGPVRLWSGYGDVTARQVRGAVQVVAADGAAEINDVVGSPVRMSSTTGDSRLNRVRTSQPLVVDVSTGSVTGSALVAPSLQVATTSGTAQLVDVRAQTVSLRSGNGPAVLNDSRVHTARVQADAGVVHVEGLTFQALEISATTGALVSTTRRFQRLQATTADGNVDATVPAGRYALALRSDSGQIHLKGVVPDQGAPASISVGTGTGDITLAGR
jgi:hypothetical protein